MTPMEFWQANGRYQRGKAEGLKSLLKQAGTTYGYWKLICQHRKRPSVDLARRLVSLSDGQLSLDGLLFPREQLRGKGAAQ